MSEKDKKKKPTYEAPAVIPFGELARGQTCAVGTSAGGNLFYVRARSRRKLFGAWYIRNRTRLSTW